MSKLEGIPQVIEFNPFGVESSSATHNLGEAVYLADQRIFRYGICNASTAAAAGKLQIAPPHITNHDNMTCAVAAIGATSVTVTPGNTAGNANIYAEGYLVINAGTGLGQTFKVKGHAAITASTAFVVQLFDPIKVALDATSKACLFHNSYNLFGVQTTGSRQMLPAGVPLVNIPVSNYGWLQTHGTAGVLCDTTTTLGAPQVASTSVAGAVTDQTDNLGASAEFPVGIATVAGVNAEYRPIFLQID